MDKDGARGFINSKSMEACQRMGAAFNFRALVDLAGSRYPLPSSQAVCLITSQG